MTAWTSIQCPECGAWMGMVRDIEEARLQWRVHFIKEHLATFVRATQGE